MFSAYADLAIMRPLALVSTVWLIWIVSIAKATELGTVSFLESTSGSYLRTASSNRLQGGKFSYADVSAATSVLLGSAPSTSLSDDSASKINELLVPNPFHRPQAVLLLTLEQVKSSKFQAFPSEERVWVGSIVAHQRDLKLEAVKDTLLLPEDALLLYLNNTSKAISDSNVAEKALEHLASFLGGSYEASRDPSRGVLTLQLLDGDVATLELENEQHRAFIYELLSILQGVKEAASTIDKFSVGLIVGTLKIPKHLHEAPDSSIMSREAFDLLHLVVTKVFTYLDRALNGSIVGVIVHAQEQILDVKSGSRSSRLQLLQTSSDTITSTVAEVLTETIIAYIVGILFIVALILGTCFLFKMPLTRDTLLYSSAKLD